MLKTHPIYTEKNDCKDCYKCVRWCPVKSIKVEKDSASIIPENCIYCGRCTLICPAKAKKVRNDIEKVKGYIAQDERVIVSLAPSYVADFEGYSSVQIISAIKKLGFSEVSETAIGAELVSLECQKLLEKEQKPFYISTACPSVVELVNIYYPHLSEYLTPIMSPLMAHASFLRNNENADVKIVFIGPCIAKKHESDLYPELIDASLTFNDLHDWFQEEGIVLGSEPEVANQNFYPVKAASANKYPVDGGMINNIKEASSFVDASFMSFSGIGNIKKVFKDITSWNTKSPVFLELLTCDGGCINGPGTSVKKSLAEKRYNVITQSESSFADENVGFAQPDIDIAMNRNVKNAIVEFSDAEIQEQLAVIGKNAKPDELDCGGCGYDSCRDFANACLNGNAEQNMCVSYMRRIAQDKATVLLQKMPSGVVMVNENMEVVEANNSFARIMGDEIETLNEINPGLAGADITKLVPFHKLFSTVLQNGEAYLERDIRENGKLIHISVFTIQKHRMVCGLLRNMFAPEVRNEEVVNRTQMVIKENLDTVQKIAFLLGENASKTEAILNTIVESHHADEESRK